MERGMTMPTGKTIYGHYCPLCGKPTVVDGKCQACLYVIGSDPDIDGSPVPHGGYSDDILVEMRQKKKAQIWSVIPGFGILFLVVGLLVYANGGPWWIGGAGIVILAVCGIKVLLEVWDMDTRAWYNRTRYWAYGEEPDWKRKRRR